MTEIHFITVTEQNYIEFLAKRQASSLITLSCSSDLIIKQNLEDEQVILGSLSL